MKISLNTLGKVNICLTLVVSILCGAFLYYNELLYRIPFYLIIPSVLILLLYLLISRHKRPDLTFFLFGLLYIYLICRCLIGGHFISNIIDSSTFYFGGLILLSALAFADIKFLDTIILIFKRLLFPHTFLSVLQLIQTNECDQVGGIFGRRFGSSNTCNHTFLLILLIIIFCELIYKRLTAKRFFIYLALIIVCGAIAEIKIIFFELAIMVFVYIILSANIKKSILVLVFVVVISIIGISIISDVNSQFSNFFSTEGVGNYLSDGYAGKTFAVTRTNGFSFITENIFENDSFSVLFGAGFNSLHEKAYISFNVLYFTYSTIYFRLGIVGFVLFGIAYSSIAFQFLVLKRTNFYILLSGIISAFSLFIAFYNSELLMNFVTPFIHLFLASGYISMKNENLKTNKLNHVSK